MISQMQARAVSCSDSVKGAAKLSGFAAFFDQKRVYAKAYAFFLLQEHFLEPRPLDGMFEKLSRTRGFAERRELTKN